MACGIVTFVKPLISEVLMPWVRSVWANAKTIRELSARLEALTEQCLEWKRKYEESRKELGEVKLFATVGLVPYMIDHPSGMPFYSALAMLGMIHRSTLVDLAVVLGSQLFPIITSFKKYVSQGLRLRTRLSQSTSRQIRPLLGHLSQFTKRIHRTIRDWQWKPIKVSPSFGPTH